MRFCPQCGTPVVAGAKFCVECGTPLNTSGSSPAAGSGAGAAGSEEPVSGADPGYRGGEIPPAAPTGGATAAVGQSGSATPAQPHFNRAFALVFGAIVAIGLGVSAFILSKLPAHERVLASAAARGNMPGNAEANASLPPGHPQVVKLPAEALKFIAQVKAKAEAAPKNLAAWNRLGEVTERAGTFDPSYYETAKRAYAHVLKLDPNNLEALRGVGDLDYDRRHYDEAIAAYDHYLARKPDDPRVRTDLGTMYLSSGETDLAMVEYKKVIAENPKFFEAYFNLGVAYAEQGKPANARRYFLKARSLAPDDRTRGEIDQMLTAVSPGGASSGETAVSAKSAGAAATGNPGTFHGGFEQMVRALPIAGPKVEAVQWTAADSARLMMRDFPMSKMPPFAAARFIDGLKSSAREVMRAHHVKGPMTIKIVDAASNHVMQSLTVDTTAAGPPAGSVAEATTADSTSGSTAGAASSGTFHDAVASMMRHLPVAGRKVAAVQWPSKMRAKVMMNDFPMQAMPPFARAKFIADIKAGLESAKTAHKIAGTVTVDIADSQTGQVMDSVSE